MKRSVNCLNAQILHIYFEDDSLVFDLAKSKGPQYGKMYLGPWHVYENPNKPWICTFLSLSIYLMTYPYTLVGKRSLFEGQDQYSRYTNISPRIVTKHRTELKTIDVEECDMVTHSSRKGVTMMEASECTVSTPIVQSAFLLVG